MPPDRIWWSAVGWWVWVPIDRAGAAVDEMGEAHLLAGRLGVEIEDHRIRLLAERAGGELALGGMEGIVEIGMHEDAAHDVGHHDARAVPREIEARAAARRAGGEIGRPQETVLARGEVQRLALVPDMVAGGDHVGAGLERGAEDVVGDAEAAGRVLAVDDDEIEPEIRNQPGQLPPRGGAAGAAYEVAEEEQVAWLPLQGRPEAAQAAFGEDLRQGDVVRLVRHAAHLLAVEGDAGQARRQSLVVQAGDGAVVVAGAVADAVAARSRRRPAAPA